LPQIVALLGDPDDSVRNAAAVVIGRIGTEDQSVIEALGRFALSEQADPTNMSAAIYSLGRIGAAATSEMRRLLQQGGANARLSCVTALQWIETPEACTMLGELLSDADQEVRRAACSGLVELGPLADTLLETFLLDDHALPRLYSAFIFLKRGRRKASFFHIIGNGLVSNHALVRREAAAIVSQIGRLSSDMLPYLIKGLQDPDNAVKTGCARALEHMGQLAAGATDALLKCLDISDDVLVCSCVRALGTSKSSEAAVAERIAALLEADSIYEDLPIEAAEALGRLGAAAAGTVPVLENLAKADWVGPDAKRVIRRAVKQITSPRLTE
jgi:HEAT repeat protein